VTRLLRFLARNRDRPLRALAREPFLRAWCHEPVRMLVRPFVSRREPDRWIFLVGCYNSGTTIMRELLAAHPEVRALPREGVRLTSVFPTPENLGWERMWTACPEHMSMPRGHCRDMVDRMVRDWSPWWGPGGGVFLEKSISHLTRLDWLQANLPNAVFLAITRNGYCVAEGIRRRARPRGPARRELGRRDYPLEMAARQWVDANERLLAAAEGSDRFLRFGYEEVTAAPAEVLERIWRWTGLACPPTRLGGGDMLYISGRPFEFRNMNPASIARLTRDDIAAVNPVIGTMQARLGYEVLS